ncbi:hypothetical protein [Phormidesmis priestleyi]|uniref:hypothetical protein n=1 Tax=Phormidesmis priestleyi TaxID=268141 RepID=UPI00083B9F70|nr:hypothetical protein [Phormidesmis priestleyi]
MQPSSATDVIHAPSTEAPCTRIDAVICDLITHIDNYSDDDFDTDWMHLTNAEVEALVIAVIRHLIATMNGKLLSGYLLEIRQESALAPEDETG